MDAFSCIREVRLCVCIWIVSSFEVVTSQWLSLFYRTWDLRGGVSPHSRRVPEDSDLWVGQLLWCEADRNYA